MTYQAVVRNATGALLTNTSVGMRISILEGALPGTTVYTETQTPVSNANGLVTIEIGGGVGFDAINWRNSIHFIKTEIDPSGGTNYTISGISQVLSVPYALFSGTTESIVDGAVSGSKIARGGATNGQTLKWNGTLWTPEDDLVGTNFWSQNGSNIFFNTGKVGIGKDPGADSRQFQVLTGSYQAVAAVNNSATYAAIYGQNQGAGPAADFRNFIRIQDGSQGAGKVLTSDATGAASWETPILAVPGGASGYVQFNNSGNFGGNASLFWDNTNSRLGIGTLIPGGKVSITTDSNIGFPHLELKETGNEFARLMFKSGYSTTYQWTIAASPFTSDAGARMNFYYLGTAGGKNVVVLTGDGKVGIGTDVPSQALHVVGDAYKTVGGTSWATSSDIRLKTIVGEYTKGLKEITALQPVVYFYKENNARKIPSADEQVGFVAQDVQKVFPESVSAGPDGYLDFNIHAINVAIVNAVKELKSENEELKTRLEKLEKLLNVKSE